MYRMNEQEANTITIPWLKKTINDELKNVNAVWPYITLKGYVKDYGALEIVQQYDEIATLSEVIQFMKDNNYAYVCSGLRESDGYQDIVFKYIQANI